MSTLWCQNDLHTDNAFMILCTGCCYPTQMKNSHPCVEGAMHHDCPICFEVTF